MRRDDVAVLVLGLALLAGAALLVIWALPDGSEWGWL